MKKILLTAFALGTLLLAGCSSTHTDMSKAPSGDNCPENVAYLQQGVDNYKVALGQYPSDVQQLLDSAGGKGPFVEKVPECPSGNIYVIQNGVVSEAPRQ